MAKIMCPACKQGEIKVSDKNYYCEYFRPSDDPEDCNFILWRNDLEKFGRGTLTDAEAIRLIKGETIELKGLKSKAGKKFDCKGVLEELDCTDGKKRWKVKFVFEDTHKTLGEDD